MLPQTFNGDTVMASFAIVKLLLIGLRVQTRPPERRVDNPRPMI
jgi:hypothetical protein